MKFKAGKDNHEYPIFQVLQIVQYTENFFPHPLPKKFQFTYCTMFMYVLLVVKQKFPVKDYKNKNITP